MLPIIRIASFGDQQWRRKAYPMITLYTFWPNLLIQWNPFCEATPFSLEKWPFESGGLSSRVEINTFMFIFILTSRVPRGEGEPLKSYHKYTR